MGEDTDSVKEIAHSAYKVVYSRLVEPYEDSVIS
jgi:hypothetical protein